MLVKFNFKYYKYRNFNNKSQNLRLDGPNKMLTKYNFHYKNVYHYKYVYYNNNLQKHRLGNPSVEDCFGNKYYYKNNLSHREDGPAVEHFDGLPVEYWLNGNFYEKEEYWNIIKFSAYL